MAEQVIKHIFLAEDDPDIMEVIKIILEMQGHQTTLISRGDEVLPTIKKMKPDLILMDVWMPGMDGREVVKILKQQESTKEIPIIMLSALSELEAIAKEADANDFVHKPFDVDFLVEKVNKYI